MWRWSVKSNLYEATSNYFSNSLFTHFLFHLLPLLTLYALSFSLLSFCLSLSLFFLSVSLSLCLSHCLIHSHFVASFSVTLCPFSFFLTLPSPFYLSNSIFPTISLTHTHTRSTITAVHLGIVPSEAGNSAQMLSSCPLARPSRVLVCSVNRPDAGQASLPRVELEAPVSPLGWNEN